MRVRVRGAPSCNSTSGMISIFAKGIRRARADTVSEVLVTFSPAPGFTTGSAVKQAFGRRIETLANTTIPQKDVPAMVQGSNSGSVLTDAVRIVVKVRLGKPLTLGRMSKATRKACNLPALLPLFLSATALDTEDSLGARASTKHMAIAVHLPRRRAVPSRGRLLEGKAIPS